MSCGRYSRNNGLVVFSGLNPLVSLNFMLGEKIRDLSIGDDSKAIVIIIKVVLNVFIRLIVPFGSVN